MIDEAPAMEVGVDSVKMVLVVVEEAMEAVEVEAAVVVEWAMAAVLL
jgi:hypothetical protein